MTHLVDPALDRAGQSIMPGYGFLGDTDLDFHDIAAHLKTNRAFGVPYTEDQIEHAPTMCAPRPIPTTRASTISRSAIPRRPSRDFDGKPGRITEMDALVAYLQMLGTQVDFKLYDDKADLR